MKNKKGLAPVLLFLSLAVVIGGLFIVYYYFFTKTAAPFVPSSEGVSIPAAEPPTEQSPEYISQSNEPSVQSNNKDDVIDDIEDGMIFEELPNPNGSQDFYGKIFVVMNGKKYGPTLGSPQNDYTTDAFIPSFVMNTTTAQYIFNFKLDGQYYVNANGTVYGPYQRVYEANISSDSRLFWNIKENGAYYVVINGQKGKPQTAPIVFYDLKNPDQFYIEGSYDQAGPYSDLTTSSLEAALRSNGQSDILVPCIGESFHFDSTRGGNIYRSVEAIGDLNNDGKKDGVIFKSYWSCGSGHFKSLQFFQSKNGKPFFVGEEYLGDRIILEQSFIDKGVLKIQMMIQGPGDGLASPTSHVYREYGIRNGKVETIAEGNVFSDFDIKRLSETLTIYKNDISQESRVGFGDSCNNHDFREDIEVLHAFSQRASDFEDFLQRQGFRYVQDKNDEDKKIITYQKNNICCLHTVTIFQEKQVGYLTCGKTKE